MFIDPMEILKARGNRYDKKPVWKIAAQGLKPDGGNIFLNSSVIGISFTVDFHFK